MFVYHSNINTVNKQKEMTNLISYTVTCVCKITGSTVVNDCKRWGRAAKKAEGLIQEDIEISHSDNVSVFETDWEKITENDCEDCNDGEWQVSQSAELSMCIEVQATNWKNAATAALEIAQDSVEIVSHNDVIIDWAKITEDMVD